MILIANCVKKELFIDAGQWKDEWDEDEKESGEFWKGQLEEGEMGQGGGTSRSGLDGNDDDGGEEDPDMQICKTQKSTSKGAAGNPSCVQQPDLHRSPSLFAGRYASVVFS